VSLHEDDRMMAGFRSLNGGGSDREDDRRRIGDLEDGQWSWILMASVARFSVFGGVVAGDRTLNPNPLSCSQTPNCG
jgi:hypothetical protein